MGMQLGVVRPIRTIHDMAQWGKLAEDIGFRLVASGDSQTMWMDPYIALSQARREGRIPPGSYALIVAFGAGFTWGATLCRAAEMEIPDAHVQSTKS